MFQEISWIEQYLFLQRERLDSVFDYAIDFDSDYDNWPCRKLMLQPFVENSIIHGRDVIQEILDNPMIAKKREVGIGISNVIARMRMHYGEEMKVEFWTEEGKGTRFIFILPMPE